MMGRVVRQRCWPLLLAVGALGCSSLLGLDPLEKVECVTDCAGANDAGSNIAGSGTAGSNTAGTGGAGTNLDLVDDFTDCDGAIIAIDGRSGVWFSLSNDTQGLSFGPPPNNTWKDQACGAFVAGMCATCMNGLGVRLATPSYDLSSYSALRVTYESESTLIVSVAATDGKTTSYATSSAIPPSGGETVATVQFASMNHEVEFPGFARVSALQFRIADNSVGFGIGIHRLELLR